MTFIASRFAPYIAILLVAVAFYGFGWIKGAGHVQDKMTALTASLEAAHNLEVQRLAGLNAKTEIVYRERLKYIRVAADVITKEVKVYVTPKDDVACPIPDGLVRLLNGAAKGDLPDDSAAPGSYAPGAIARQTP